MSARTAVLVAVVLAVTLACGAPAATAGGTGTVAAGGGYRLVPADGVSAVAPATAAPGGAAGGAYHLVPAATISTAGPAPAVPVSTAGGTASGGGYRLTVAAPDGNGTPCCCTFMPCTLRNR